MYGKQAKYNLALSLSLMRGYIRNVVKRKRKVLKIAHRGASRYAPENTLVAVTEAMRLGADAVEINVHRTKDKEVVVQHDHSLYRTTRKTGFVEDFTLQEIRESKEVSADIIPTLQDVFSVVKKNCILKIDIKDRDMEEEVIAIIRQNRASHSAIITSHIGSVLKKIKIIAPEIQTESGGWRKKKPIKDIVRGALDLRANIVSPHYTIINKRLVDLAHKKKLKVHVWTVDDEDIAKKMKILGVDGITTNYLDRI